MDLSLCRSSYPDWKRSKKSKKETTGYARRNETFNFKGLKLLCAEDNELNVEILGAMLEMAGAVYAICRNGKELVETFEKALKL